MRTTSRRAAATRLVVLGTSSLVAACVPAGASDGGLTGDEQRLIPQIVRQQEQRVRDARQALDMAQDLLMGLRQRQRMLIHHGRVDLAQALEPLAEEKELDVQRLQQRLRDACVRPTAGRAVTTEHQGCSRNP